MTVLLLVLVTALCAVPAHAIAPSNSCQIVGETSPGPRSLECFAAAQACCQTYIQCSVYASRVCWTQPNSMLCAAAPFACIAADQQCMSNSHCD